MLKFNPNPPNHSVIDVNNLPKFGFLFFFKNMAGYRAKFILLTIITVCATLTSFGATWLLAYIVNHISSINLTNLFTIYIPVFMGLVFAREWGGYYIRKYGELLPISYTNHLKLRFFSTWLSYGSNKFMNYGKEKLIIYQDKYINYIFNFLNDWNWLMARNITLLGIIIGILLYQSPWILIINIIYMVGFLALSMYLSRVISKPLKKYHEADNDLNRVKQNFILNIIPIKKLHRNDFFINFFKKYISLTNKSIQPFRQIHANRWFLQLNLFNIIFAITFFYGIYQVIKGELPIGYILLLQFAFNNLLNILIYFVEYYTGLINQKQDITLFKEELKELQLQYDPTQKEINTHVTQIDSRADFVGATNLPEGVVERFVYRVKINKGDKIAIIGPSGSGKSTFIHILLGLIRYHDGFIWIENKMDNYRENIFGKDYYTMPYLKNIAYVNSTDPLLDMTLYENITTDTGHDKEPLPEKLVHICIGLGIHEFVNVNQFDQPVSKLNLSTGQIQRIKLARALYSNADIYFFDEPFNGLGGTNKLRCQSFINEQVKDKTVIMVTHHDYEIPAGYTRYKMEDNCLIRI